MEIINESSHRILAYLIGLEGQAYHPTADELNAYARSSDQLTTVSIPAFVAQYANLIPDYLRQTTETETAGQWVLRLKLAAMQDKRFHSTHLGRALLAAVDERELVLESSPMIAIVLKQDDDFALATVMAKIAEVGAAVLIDPYLRMDGFIQLAQHTAVTRIITGPDKKDGRLQALSAGLAAVGQIGTVPEIRVAEVFHDRYVIPDASPIWMLGTSLNGVGNKTSTMVQVADNPAGLAIRGAFQEAWAKATPIAAFVAAQQPAVQAAKATKERDSL